MSILKWNLLIVILKFYFILKIKNKYKVNKDSSLCSMWKIIQDGFNKILKIGLLKPIITGCQWSWNRVLIKLSIFIENLKTKGVKFRNLKVSVWHCKVEGAREFFILEHIKLLKKWCKKIKKFFPVWLAHLQVAFLDWQSAVIWNLNKLYKFVNKN